MTTEFAPASAASLFLFLCVVASTLIMILWGAQKVRPPQTKPMILFLLCWIGALSAVVQSGLLRSYTLPALPLFFLFINIGAFVFAFSTWGKALTNLPLWHLVIFQGFRFPLEIVLHFWVKEGTIPETMTWSGQNFDVISGILALGAFAPAFRSKTYAWVFNVVSFLLLLNVLRVVALSSPLPFSWPLENSLRLTFYMPYALVGIVCVWAALAGHIILTRALLTNKQNRVYNPAK